MKKVAPMITENGSRTSRLGWVSAQCVTDLLPRFCAYSLHPQRVCRGNVLHVVYGLVPSPLEFSEKLWISQCQV